MHLCERHLASTHGEHRSTVRTSGEETDGRKALDFVLYCASGGGDGDAVQHHIQSTDNNTHSTGSSCSDIWLEEAQVPSNERHVMCMTLSLGAAQALAVDPWWLAYKNTFMVLKSIGTLSFSFAWRCGKHRIYI